MDDLTANLIGLTLRVQAYRIVRRIERETMAIDMSGLKAKAMAARANWERLNAAYEGFNTTAPLHAADVEALSAGLAEMQSDLDFATATMGNSPPVVPPKEPPAAPPTTAGDAVRASMGHPPSRSGL